MIEAAKSGKTLTPDIVRKGDSTAKLAMMLADIYHEAREYEKSLELCNRLLASAAIKRASAEQRSYAYYKRARNTYLMMAKTFDANATVADYLAAVSAAPKAEWADEALFYAANVDWNHKQDVDAAVLVWQRLVREYPNSKEAPRSALYIGVALLEKTISRGAQGARGVPGALSGFATRSHGKAASGNVRARCKIRGETEMNLIVQSVLEFRFDSQNNLG